MSYTYAVITRVADPATGGNLAMAFDLFHQTEQPDIEKGNYLGTFERVPMDIMLTLRAPVFEVGELLVLGESGREVLGAGRKPDKWDVDYEEFNAIEDAVRLAKDITEKDFELAMREHKARREAEEA
jgi:hypothetical protein